MTSSAAEGLGAGRLGAPGRGRDGCGLARPLVSTNGRTDDDVTTCGSRRYVFRIGGKRSEGLEGIREASGWTPHLCRVLGWMLVNWTLDDVFGVMFVLPLFKCNVIVTPEYAESVGFDFESSVSNAVWSACPVQHCQLRGKLRWRALCIRSHA